MRTFCWRVIFRGYLVGHLQGTRVILRRWKSLDLELSQIATLLIASGPCSSFTFCSEASAQTVERIKGFRRGLRGNFLESLILTSKNCLCVHFCLWRKTKDFESVSKGWRVLPLDSQFSPNLSEILSYVIQFQFVFVLLLLLLVEHYQRLRLYTSNVVWSTLTIQTTIWHTFHSVHLCCIVYMYLFVIWCPAVLYA